MNSVHNKAFSCFIGWVDGNATCIANRFQNQLCLEKAAESQLYPQCYWMVTNNVTFTTGLQRQKSSVLLSSWFLRRPYCLPETLFEGEHSFIYSHLVYVLSESYVSLAFPWGKTRLKSSSYQWQTQGRLLARREKRFPYLLNGTSTVQKRFHLPELLREQCAGF